MIVRPLPVTMYQTPGPSTLISPVPHSDKGVSLVESIVVPVVVDGTEALITPLQLSLAGGRPPAQPCSETTKTLPIISKLIIYSCKYPPLSELT